MSGVFNGGHSVYLVRGRKRGLQKDGKVSIGPCGYCGLLIHIPPWPSMVDGVVSCGCVKEKTNDSSGTVLPEAPLT